MGLRSIQFPTQTISISASDEALKVRGLSFADFAILYAKYGAELSVIFSNFVREGAQITPELVGAALGQLTTQAPAAVAHAIALACDEPEAVDQAIRLPMTDQALLLDGIFRLSFQSEAELKKLVEIVANALEGVGSAVQMLTKN